MPGHPNTHIQEFIYIGEIEDIVPPGIAHVLASRENHKGPCPSRADSL